MKKTILFIAMAFLCLNIPGIALGRSGNHFQSTDLIPLNLGEKIPTEIFNNLIPSEIDTINLRDYKGKSIILDFWATWCTACIHAFPKVERLNQKYAKNLQIILVNTSDRDSRQKVEGFISAKKKDGSMPNCPVLLHDKVLIRLFPHKVIPHYVWIGQNGKVKAFTDSEDLTDMNVERLMAGLELDLKKKEQ